MKTTEEKKFEEIQEKIKEKFQGKPYDGYCYSLTPHFAFDPNRNLALVVTERQYDINNMLKRMNVAYQVHLYDIENDKDEWLFQHDQVVGPYREGTRKEFIPRYDEEKKKLCLIIREYYYRPNADVTEVTRKKEIREY